MDHLQHLTLIIPADANKRQLVDIPTLTGKSIDVLNELPYNLDIDQPIGESYNEYGCGIGIQRHYVNRDDSGEAVEISVIHEDIRGASRGRFDGVRETRIDIWFKPEGGFVDSVTKLNIINELLEPENNLSLEEYTDDEDVVNTLQALIP